MYEGDAQIERMSRALNPDRTAIELDLAPVGTHAAVERPDERALSGPVLAEKRMHLALGELQLRSAERLGRTEALVDIAQSDACQALRTFRAGPQTPRA